MVHGCQGFHRKMFFCLTIFLIHIFSIDFGNSDIEYNTLKVRKLLDALKDGKNVRSFQIHPVEVYLKSDEGSKGKLEGDVNFDDYFNLALRTASSLDFSRDKVETSKTGKLLRYQHRKKMEDIIEFLRDRYSSTNYFYNEMKRIQSQYTVKDKMREMIDYCEYPQNYKVKDKILKLFDKLKKKNEKEQSLWNEPTNNLVINVLKDPYNDGVVN